MKRWGIIVKVNFTRVLYFLLKPRSHCLYRGQTCSGFQIGQAMESCKISCHFVYWDALRHFSLLWSLLTLLLPPPFYRDTCSQLLPVKYPCGKNTQSCTSPDQQKDSKYNITENIKLCIVKHLGQLQEDVGTVVGQQHQTSTSKMTSVEFRHLIISDISSPFVYKVTRLYWKISIN